MFCGSVIETGHRGASMSQLHDVWPQLQDSKVNCLLTTVSDCESWLSARAELGLSGKMAMRFSPCSPSFLTMASHG